MSLNGDIHVDARRIVFVAPATATPAAATYISAVILQIAGMMYVAFETIFTRASGGTTLDAYLQTSLDGGTTWIDIHQHSYATTTASKVTVTSGYSGTALTNAPVPVVPGDAALTANTTVPGLLGDRLRLKYVVAGSYVGTFSASAIVKG
jgi:hypothetical protein